MRTLLAMLLAAFICMLLVAPVHGNGTAGNCDVELADLQTRDYGRMCVYELIVHNYRPDDVEALGIVIIYRSANFMKLGWYRDECRKFVRTSIEANSLHHLMFTAPIPKWAMSADIWLDYVIDSQGRRWKCQ